MIRTALCGLALLGLGAAARAGELDREAGPKPAVPAAPAVAAPVAGSELDRESPAAAHRWRGGWGWGPGWGPGWGWGGGWNRGWGWGGGWGGWGYRPGFSLSIASYPAYYGWGYPAWGNVNYYGFGGFGFGYSNFYGGYGCYW
jgi:hypothetical protein